MNAIGQTVGLDEDVRSLQAFFDPAREITAALDASGYRWIPGRVTVDRLSADTVGVSVTIRLHGSRFDESRGHRLFEEAKHDIALWQTEHPRAVTLELIVLDYYREDQLYIRTQDFPTTPV